MEQLEKRRPKGEIKYKFTLDDDQKEAKRLIIENELIIITGNAGSGKSAVVAQTVLDLLFKKIITKISVTRPTVEVGKSLGALPGFLHQKLDPYIDPFKDSLYNCYDKEKVDKHFENTTIVGKAIQFIRGTTFAEGSILVADEIQNTTKQEVLALITRLGKGGKIILIGDNGQRDTRETFTGLDYMIELSKSIPEIKHIKLKNNHRSDLVGKILDYEYRNK